MNWEASGSHKAETAHMVTQKMKLKENNLQHCNLKVRLATLWAMDSKVVSSRPGYFVYATTCLLGRQTA